MLFSMKITELYQKVVGVVIMVTGINENDILHSNREECADARYLLVRVLSDKLSDKETGLLIGRTRQGVSFIRSNDTKMRKWSVMSAWREIDDHIKGFLFDKTLACITKMLYICSVNQKESS